MIGAPPLPRLIGKLKKKTIEENVKTSGWERETPPSRMRLIFVDENSDEWEEEYETAELMELRREGEARGMNTASRMVGEQPPSGTAAPGVHPLGWSYGNDSRVAKPVNGTYPANDNILMRVGQLDGGCTATLVGRRLVLTAAHCVTDGAGNLTNGHVYRPRQDGAISPWGSEANTARWFDGAYFDNNCNISYTAANRELCGRYDWVLLRLGTSAWNANGGSWAAMGYWVPGSSGWYAWNNGYASCGLPESPSGCVAATAYGENVGHSFFNVRGPDQSGENTIFNSANDMSPGHSGGPIFSPTYPDSVGGPYLLGVLTNQMCGTCNEPGVSTNDRTYPMMSRRMTSTLAGLINDKRAIYP